MSTSVLYSLGYVKDIDEIYQALKQLTHKGFDRNRVESYMQKQVKGGHIDYYAYDEATGNAKKCPKECGEAFLKTIKTGCKDRNNMQLMVRYRKNKMGNWACEGVSHQDHLEVVLNTYTIGYITFPDFAAANDFIESLHDRLLAGERWAFAEGQGNPNLVRRKTNYQILESYLQQVFAKLMLEYTHKRSDNYQKIVFSNDGKYCYFNTGLLTKFARPVFLVGEVKNRKRNGHFYCHKPCANKGLRDLVNEYNFNEEDVSPGPEMATFFNDIGEIIYDTNVDIDFTDDKLSHIIIDGLERGRFPEHYQRAYEEQREAAIFGIAEKLRSSIETAELIAKRNFKYVVPQYRPAGTTVKDGGIYHYKGQIQFLMPIYLDFNLYEMPDFALVLSYEGGFYVPETILTLSWAYNNARILCKPDDSWLQANLIFDADEDELDEPIIDTLPEEGVEEVEEAEEIEEAGERELEGQEDTNQGEEESQAGAENLPKDAVIGHIFSLKNIEQANNGGVRGTFGKENHVATISKKRLKNKRYSQVKGKTLRVKIIGKNHLGNSYQAELIS